MKSNSHLFARGVALILSTSFVFVAMPLSAQQKELKQPYPVALKLVLELLAQPDLQKELELDEGQIRNVKTLVNEYSQEIQTELMKIQALPITRKEQMREALKELEEARKEKTLEIDIACAKQLDDVLLPFQRQRIGQIGIQLLHAKPVFVSVFKSKAMAKQAELTEKEERALSRVTSQAETDYLRELRELKLKYHQQVRDSLSLEIRTVVEEILGAPYITDPEIKDK